MTRMQKPSGFTLVELAIVLVIIGLIVGGVLTGSDLIKAATIRSTVSDFEKYNAGATTFQSKYNGLPGDLKASKAVEFNLSGAADTNATGLAGLRDGNGAIEGGSANATNLIGEVGPLWKDLGAVGLLGGTCRARAYVKTPTISSMPSMAKISFILPASRLASAQRLRLAVRSLPWRRKQWTRKWMMAFQPRASC